MTAANRRQRQLRHLAAASLAGCAALALLLFFVYPGGNPYNPIASYYSMAFNSICDLGKTVAWNDVANPLGPPLFFLMALAGAIAWTSTMWLFPSLFPHSRAARLARWPALVAGASALGIGLTPADIMPAEHMWAIALAAVAALPALVLVLWTVVRHRSQAPRYADFTAVAATAFAIDVQRFVGHFCFDTVWLPGEPLMTKVVVGLGLCWLGFTLQRVWRLEEVEGTSRSLTAMRRESVSARCSRGG